MVFLKIIQSHLPAAKQYLMFTVVYKYKVSLFSMNYSDAFQN